MKPKTIMRPEIPITRDSLLVRQDKLESKKMSIETPIGKLESDSGSHLIDVTSIVLVIGVLYVGKKLVDKYVK